MVFHDLGSDLTGDESGADKLRSLFGPGQVDQAIRQAIQMCWMMLPPEKKTPDELEANIRRIVDRAIQNFRDDAKIFGNS